MADIHAHERRSSGIFICYRRGMAAGHARALKDRLLQRFPPPVFIDVDSIAPGNDWGEEIEDAPAVRLGEYFEDGHRFCIADELYICQDIQVTGSPSSAAAA